MKRGEKFISQQSIKGFKNGKEVVVAIKLARPFICGAADNFYLFAVNIQNGEFCCPDPNEIVMKVL